MLAARAAHTRPAAYALSLLVASVTAGCALFGGEPPDPPASTRKEVIFAVTAADQLVSFNAGAPGKLLTSRPLIGLRSGEEILGIDYRVAKGVLYALGRTGSESRLMTIDTGTGRVAQVGTGSIQVPLNGSEFGFDFNPTVDRIRVVSDTGQNLRLHPDTGAVVDADPNAAGLQIDGALAYDASDKNAGRRPSIVGAGYTYNRTNEKITTNYAIDAFAGTLVVQGSLEGATPAVSPNTGRLFTVGPLGAGAIGRAAFDIADVSGAAFVAITRPGASVSRFYLVDLDTGRTTFLGRIGGSEAIRGISFQP
ncbi:MAG: DUF4394 domain-containing protein [Proteobacteria bacterium]|nr:DUF4394 domain-containing protein [Burkholderiales bacterium]